MPLSEYNCLTVTSATAAVTTHLATVSDPEVPKRMRECDLGCAGPGSVIGEAGYYARICYQLPEHLRDKESWRVLFARRDGVEAGFAMFRRTHKWERARPAGELSGVGTGRRSGCAARAAAPAGRLRPDRDRSGRGRGCPAPSHTTGHAGPHPAVRQAV
jgi:hypothetical protein